MNALLIIGIFCAIVFIGWCIYRGYRERKLYFESLTRFCDNLITEIGFSKKTLAQIIDGYHRNYDANFSADLLGYRELLEKRGDVNQKGLTWWDGLKPNERDAVAEFFIGLGRHSVAEEVEKIKTARARFDVFRAESAEKLKSEASIYFKVCILLGIAVVVLLL